MFCSKCGQPLRAGAKFCGKCGTPARKPVTEPTIKPERKTTPSAEGGEVFFEKRETSSRDHREVPVKEKPSLVSTMPEPGGGSDEEFHSWFSDAGDL